MSQNSDLDVLCRGAQKFGKIDILFVNAASQFRPGKRRRTHYDEIFDINTRRYYSIQKRFLFQRRRSIILNTSAPESR